MEEKLLMDTLKLKGYKQVRKTVDDSGYTSCFQKRLGEHSIFVVCRITKEGSISDVFGLVGNEVMSW